MYTFSQFIHWHILQQICYKTIIKDRTTPNTHRYTTLRKYTFENCTCWSTAMAN